MNKYLQIAFGWFFVDALVYAPAAKTFIALPILLLIVYAVDKLMSRKKDGQG